MPGYVSHIVMANDVYKLLKNKNVDINYMVTYSLGGDLSKYAKCRYASHHIDMDKFIYNMALYIKDNKLTDNKVVMGVLYGHICHYMMDDTVHPLVRKISHECQKNKKNHTLIELYYDAYLVKKVFNMRIDEYSKQKLLLAKGDKNVNKLIDYAYLTTYKANNISTYYKFNIWLYRKVRYLYKICSYNFLYGISGIKHFLLVNRDIDIVNKEHMIRYHSYSKCECHKSLDDVYKEAIDRAIKYIYEINKYLNI